MTRTEGPEHGRDRLRELLDAVLDEQHRSLGEMAGGAFASPYHFSRQLTRQAGEPPVAMRRRVMLERAHWQLRRGLPVTRAAWDAGYDTVEGFARAFARAYGHPPSRTPDDAGSPDWLPAPNGIHFHPPTSLWVHHQEQPMNVLSDHLVQHDLDDTRTLLDLATQLPDETYRAVGLPGNTVLCWDGAEESIAGVLEHQVFTKEVWVAAIAGEDFPGHRADQPAELIARHDAAAPRWLGIIRDIDRRQAWDDRIVDALCDPPESFVLGGVVAHVLTYAAHRRQLARHLIRRAGHEVDHGDPIDWLRRRTGSER